MTANQRAPRLRLRTHPFLPRLAAGLVLSALGGARLTAAPAEQPLATEAQSAASASPIAEPPEEIRGEADLAGVLGGPTQLPAARLRLEIHAGNRLLEQGLPGAAEPHFRVVTQSAPEHPGGWYLLSRALAAARRPADAREAAQMAVDRLRAMPAEVQAAFNPARFHYNLGLASATMGLLDDAETALRLAVAALPHDARVRYELATVLQRKGLAAEAADQFRQASAQAPERPEIWRGLGEALLGLNDLAGAEKALLEAEKRDASSPDVRHALASVYRAQGRFEDQERMLAEYEKLNAAYKARQESAEAARRRLAEARALLEGGKGPQAVAAYEALLADTPTAGEARARVLVGLGQARAKVGDTEAARADLERAVGDAPRSFVAQFELGTLLARAGRMDEAASHLVEAVALDPFDGGAHQNLALSYALLGRLNRALAEGLKASVLEPDDTRIRQFVVDLQWALGHEAEARALAAAGDVELPKGRQVHSAPEWAR